MNSRPREDYSALDKALRECGKKDPVGIQILIAREIDETPWKTLEHIFGYRRSTLRRRMEQAKSRLREEFPHLRELID